MSVLGPASAPQTLFPPGLLNRTGRCRCCRQHPVLVCAHGSEQKISCEILKSISDPAFITTRPASFDGPEFVSPDFGPEFVSIGMIADTPAEPEPARTAMVSTFVKIFFLSDFF